MQRRELANGKNWSRVTAALCCVVVMLTVLTLSTQAWDEVRGKIPRGHTRRPILGTGNAGSSGNEGHSRAVAICRVSGHQECDVYEDWIEVDGVRTVTGYHLENCHAVVDSTQCDSGGTGGGGGTDPNDLQTCLKASQDAANSRNQAIRDGQKSCMASLGSFANQECTGLVTPMGWTDIDTNTFNAFSGRYCTRPPRPSPRESEDHFDNRYNQWHRVCQHDIALSLTADERSRCADDLRRGSGDFWNKFVIHAGPLGSFGWDIGTNQNQGFEAACNQQTTQLLLESNKKKTDDDISCHNKYGH